MANQMVSVGYLASSNGVVTFMDSCEGVTPITVLTEQGDFYGEHVKVDLNVRNYVTILQASTILVGYGDDLAVSTHLNGD